MKHSRKWISILLCMALLCTCLPPAAAQDAAEPPPAQETEEGAPPAETTPGPAGEPSPTPELPQEQTPAPEPSPVPQGASWDTAFTLEEGKPFSGEITSGQPDVYFRLTTGRKGYYRFASGGSLAVEARLVNESKAEVAAFSPNQQEDGAEPKHFVDGALLGGDAVYFLAVRSERPGRTGRFSVVFEAAAEPEATVEPTAEPTMEPTAEPTIEPRAEPTAELTSEPTTEPTIEPTAEPTPEPTVEPTAELTPEPTVEPTAEPTAEPTVEPTGEPTVEPTAEPTPEPTIEATAEPTVEPTAEPTAEPTIEPTAEPIAEPAIEPTAEPTAEPITDGREENAPEASPEMLTASLLTEQPQDALPTPKPALEARTAPSGMLTGRASSGVGRSFDGAAVTRGYPQSAHPYASGQSGSWYYSAEGAQYLALTFSADTYVEYGYDLIRLYDSQGNLLTFEDASGNSFDSFTGGELRGVTLLSPSPGFYITLDTDGDGAEYGFAIRDIQPKYVAAPTLGRVDQNGADSVYLAWSQVAGAEGYAVSRREGDGGAYQEVLLTSFLGAQDSGLLPGKLYYYAVRSYQVVSGVRVYSAYSNEVGETILDKPGIVAAYATGSTSAGLTWTGVRGSSGYALYTSASEGGPYTRVKTSSKAAYTFTRLPASTLVFFKVAAYTYYNGQEVTGALSDWKGVATLGAPSSVSLSQQSVDSIFLSWKPVPGASGYCVERGTAKAGPYTGLGAFAGTSCTDAGLTPGQTYYYRVSAYIEHSGMYPGMPSSVKSLRLLSRPAFSSAAAASATKASLKWSRVSGAKGYILYMASSPAGEYTALKTLSGTSTTVSGLAPGKVYYFKVAAYVLMNKAVVPGDVSDIVPVLLMAAPKLQTAVQSGGSAYFAWTPVEGASGYALFQSDKQNGVYSQIAVTAGLTSATVGGIGFSAAYYYKVRAVREQDGASYAGPFSSAVRLQVLSQPVINTARSNGSTSVYLKWSCASKPSGYALYMSQSPDGPFVQIKTTSSASLTVSRLAPGTAYYFKVAAYSTLSGTRSYSDPSAVASAMPLAAPSIRSAGQNGPASVQVAWYGVPGAEGYALYRSASSKGEYVQVLTTAATWANDETARPGMMYYYKVAATKLAGGQVYGSLLSGYKSASLLGVPAITVLQAQSNDAALLQWSRVSGATGYTVSMAAEAAGPYTLLASTSSRSILITNLYGKPAYYFKVAAYKKSGGVNIRGQESEAAQLVMGTPMGSYRALLIGQQDYQYINDLNGHYDTSNMATMLGYLSMGGESYSVVRRTNQTASQILSGISSAFAGAGDGDVSLFYYSGHGDAGTSSSAGALVGVDSNLVTPSQLRAALDAVKGKVIVILDSCGSGAIIYDKSGAQAAMRRMPILVTRDDASRFNKAVVEAFKYGTTKSGEMRADKYVVLTACEYGETSLEVLYPGHDPYGVFTRSLCRAGGWDLFNKAKVGLMGDANHDSVVTLNEAYSYIYSDLYGDYDQVVQAYPSGSAYPLFQR